MKTNTKRLKQFKVRISFTRTYKVLAENYYHARFSAISLALDELKHGIEAPCADIIMPLFRTKRLRPTRNKKRN